MDHLFLGINFPAPRSYERIRVENVNLNESVSFLIEKFRNLTGIKDEVSVCYLGNILEDDEPITRYGLHAGSTVHILKKAAEEGPKEYTRFTELDCSRICSNFRSLNNGNFYKISRPEVAKMIFDEHPELQKDVVAMSILKDPILLSNLQNPETVRKVAQHHRVLIEASDTIVKALKTAKNLTESPQVVSVQPMTDELSDSSSSSSGSERNSPQASGSGRGNRITHELLRQSLAAATQGRNSLSNISRRNLAQAGGESNSISPSTSSGSVPTGHRFISSSMFMNAMNEVLLANRRANPSVIETPAEEQVQESPAPPPAEEESMEEDRDVQDARDIEMITSFQTQLKQMEDMGLRNKATNIQALMVCNGNLEAAVNLVLAEMNTDMS